MSSWWDPKLKEPQGFNYQTKRREKASKVWNDNLHFFYLSAFFLAFCGKLYSFAAFSGDENSMRRYAGRCEKMIDYDSEWQRLFSAPIQRFFFFLLCFNVALWLRPEKSHNSSLIHAGIKFRSPSRSLIIPDRFLMTNMIWMDVAAHVSVEIGLREMHATDFMRNKTEARIVNAAYALLVTKSRLASSFWKLINAQFTKLKKLLLHRLTNTFRRVYQALFHFSRVSLRSVSPSSSFSFFLNFSAASSRVFKLSMLLITTQSPFSFRYVWFRSAAVGSPCGKLIGVIFTRCLIFHRRALFSGMFFTTQTFGDCQETQN